MADPLGRRVLLAGWLGFALAALFFYPLAAALADNPFYLQWQRRDLHETVAALALLTVAFAAGVHLTWHRRSKAGNAALALLASVPIASLLSGVLQQLPFDAALIQAWDHAAVRYGLPAVLTLALLIVFVRWPAVFGAWLRGGILALSLVALVVTKVMIASNWYRQPPVAVGLDAAVASSGERCGSVLALLFDELSFAYLFDGTAVSREYPDIARVAAGATSYLRVSAPAHETLLSMPAYLAGRSFHDVRATAEGLITVDDQGHAQPFTARGEDSLFATARRLGFRTEMAGYYLPYCDLLGPLVDVCQSLSFYNASRVDAGFSILHPIATTLILWPRQFPFGLLKNPPFARLQRDLVQRTLDFALRPEPAATFRFVHFSVPHLPFAFDGRGFNPGLDPLRTDPDDRYVAQIHYVDRLVGTIADHLRRDGAYERTTIVLLSDHGFRFGGRDRDPTHIPFIVKAAGQTTGRKDDTPMYAADLLRSTVAASCR